MDRHHGMRHEQGIAIFVYTIIMDVAARHVAIGFKATQCITESTHQSANKDYKGPNQ
jgi:hypothetical protein